MENVLSDAAQKWARDLAEWAIPESIMTQAPESPWIHPPAMFTLPSEIPDSPSHQRAREAMPSNGSVLDIGCGGGIAAFAIAPPAGTVIGVDHQDEMLKMFAESANAKGFEHQEVLGDWPDVSPQTPIADVVTCHHVAYNVAQIEPFLKALDSHATKRVVIEIPQQHPLSTMRDSWKHFWNLDRPVNPTPQDLIAVLAEMGIAADLELWQGPKLRPLNIEDDVRFLRIRLCLDSSRDQEIRQFLESQKPMESRALATIWWDVED
jgi:SAM-dependent methyltransferase